MHIRVATEADIPSIIAIEQVPEFRQYIGQWTEQQHLAALTSNDAHYIVSEENKTINGFVILRGLSQPHRNIELMRIAVAQPNNGRGRQLFSHALHIAFNQLNTHRVWLDVFDTNLRAQRVYKSFGFQTEGLLRESQLIDGHFKSQFIMSLLEDEYSSSL